MNIAEKLFSVLMGKVTKLSSGMETINETITTTTSDLTALEGKVDTGLSAINDKVDNMIIESGTSDAETIASRTDSVTGKTYSTLGNRLDTQFSEIKEDLSALFATETLSPEWVVGTIGTGNGDNYSSSTSCRTLGYIEYTAPLTVTLADGVKYSWRRYSASKAFISSSDWIMSSGTLEFNEGEYIRFVCTYTGGTTAMTTVVAAESVILSVTHFTDTSLSLPNKAADAKKTGDAIAAVGAEVSVIHEDLSDITNVGSVFTPNWERGSIRIDTGSNLSSEIIARSLGYIVLTRGVARIAADESVFYSWRLYNNDETYIQGSSEWLSGTQELTFEAGEKLRIVCKYSNDTAIALEDINNLLEISDQSGLNIVGKALSPKKIANGKVQEWNFINASVHTDKTLSIEGEPADAKVTGNKITELANHTQIKILTKFERGTINSDDGTDWASSSRMRSREQLPMYVVVVPETLQVSFRLYQNGAIIYADKNWREGGIYNPLEISPNATSMRIILRYSSDRTIQPEDIVYANDNVYLVSDENIVDYIISNQHNANQDIAYTENSVGNNISVKAAKTIYFDDGTPPYIDWYLLCDQSGSFYRSKDLRSKEKLFTFVPPVSTFDNWSVGIDGNNNIIFIINASDLVGSSTGLNDSIRINPVYYLASENYSTMHTLDFGDNLKPVGWLENVGWLVLPNGDVIMCEYTRPKVKTCNVWHIDSTDITNSNNWSPVWSHDIVNAVYPSTPGMKHCHYVAYDFYTGICYFGTGDSEDGSIVYYSTDNGLTWTVAWGPSRKLCRSLNLVFTQDKVYWGSDSWESQYHSFFVAERLSNGVVDGTNCTEIPLGQVNAQSCYGCVYLPHHGLVVMMDYNDQAEYDALEWQAYDLQSGEIVTIHTFGRVSGSTLHLGFRCMYVDWYPTGDCILVGFALNPGTHRANEVNSFKGVGNKSTLDGRVNNLLLYVNRIGENFDVRMSTIYI